MNNSTIAVLDLTNHYIYIGFGCAALASNLIVLFVLCLHKAYFLKSALITGLATSDVINGISLLITGVVRIRLLKANQFTDPTHPLECFKTFSTPWIIGNQLFAVMMLTIGLERICAVAFVGWYFTTWTNRLAWAITFFVYVYCAVSFGALWIINLQLPFNATVTRACFTPPVMGSAYGTYSYILAITCGTVSGLCTGLALTLFLARKKKLYAMQSENSFQRFVKKQWQITTSMSCIALFDFGLVAMPNAMLLMSVFYPEYSKTFNVGYWASALVCLRSCMTLIVYLIFNQEFRENFLKTFAYKLSNTVHALSKNAGGVKMRQEQPQR